jgi:hypothetical protein
LGRGEERAQAASTESLVPRPGSYEELRAAPKVDHDLPQDSWGAGIVVIVKDLADILTLNAECWQVLRCTFALFTLFLNLYMQIQVLYWVWIYVIGMSVRTIQEHYKMYHAEVYNENEEFVEDRWNNFPFRHDMCQAAITQLLFLGAVLFFWTARMLSEIRGCERLSRYIWQIPSLPPDAGVEDMVHETFRGGDELHQIIGLNKSTRFMLFTLILIPKACICVVLLLLGCQWLTSTESFGDLILNALALEFIIHIDELFFESFFPKRMWKNIDMTKISLPKRAISHDEDHRALIVEYTRSMFYVIATFGFVYLYLIHFQQVLPGYTGDISHCNEFIEEHYAPICGFFSESCFPFGVGGTQGAQGMSSGAGAHGSSHSLSHSIAGLEPKIHHHKRPPAPPAPDPLRPPVDFGLNSSHGRARAFPLGLHGHGHGHAHGHR